MKFRDLEQELDSYETSRPLSSLDEWYLSVRDTPLDCLSVGDVCRALRQDLYVREILPIGIALFIDDVLEGERYDGELLVALAGLRDMYWHENVETSRKVAVALAEVSRLSADTELLRAASALSRVLDAV
ncbi:contact-dependent growth inhibition system immunity protein [Pseudomonas sp. COW5]|uniref:contact-dependent growth inhibition system immunity protein n=1 Tax=Pseudomonas sp. COW5 TaxID=2981253 RepID=UPI0022476D68|nr:contact-dependent growth inhibition system immunity protein [Pseudomonas sp. COW5]MCX2545959.1 contact-dependent growth inhibition system immunity protein [Pseudomonas sp. COW5]